MGLPLDSAAHNLDRRSPDGDAAPAGGCRAIAPGLRALHHRWRHLRAARRREAGNNPGDPAADAAATRQTCLSARYHRRAAVAGGGDRQGLPVLGTRVGGAGGCGQGPRNHDRCLHSHTAVGCDDARVEGQGHLLHARLQQQLPAAVAAVCRGVQLAAAPRRPPQPGADPAHRCRARLLSNRAGQRWCIRRSQPRQLLGWGAIAQTGHGLSGGVRPPGLLRGVRDRTRAAQRPCHPGANLRRGRQCHDSQRHTSRRLGPPVQLLSGT